MVAATPVVSWCLIPLWTGLQNESEGNMQSQSHSSAELDSAHSIELDVEDATTSLMYLCQVPIRT